MDLPTVLQNAQHPNLDIRTQAENFLNQAVEAQYGPFLLALCVEFATEGKPESNRHLAGLYIKNLISAIDDDIAEQKKNKWIQCDTTMKEQIRAGFLQAILSPVQVVSHTAAQVLAAYGAVDVPLNAWPSLLQSLFQNINSPSVHDLCKVSSLEALGYLCDAMQPDGVEPAVVNQILSSIIDGMRADRNNNIRLAAVKALNNSLDFTGNNFENATERDVIIKAICEGTQSSDMKIRENSFQCFVSVADIYYDKLKPYAETMFQLSVVAIKSDDPSVGMQAIELWNTISDHEISLMEAIADEEAKPEELLQLTNVAAPTLVPLLLECMTKQEDDEDDDSDSWDIAKASAALLDSMSTTIEDAIVPIVIPFVTQNINNNDWHIKEASLMAFGMILDGPSPVLLGPYVIQAMPILIACLSDPSTAVRDTSAWTIGRICLLHKNCLSSNVLPPLVNGVAAVLEDKSNKVVAQACYAVFNLADACSDESEAPSNVLSHFMPLLLTKLLAITLRPDTSESNSLRASAYESINMMVTNSAMDMQSIILQLLAEALNRLEASYNLQINAQERMNLQSCLCSLVGEIVKKLEFQLFEQLCDRIMTLLLKVFESKGAIAHEDAFMSIGHMASKMGSSFIRYASHMQGPLVAGLKSFDEYSLCTVTVGCVGDLSRALGPQILPFCDDIMRCLLELLQSQVVHRSVKPHVIGLFSDIAMAIEGDFERYTSIVLSILKQAGEVNISSDDEELVEYINTLRNSILEAYTGILQGLKAVNKQDSILPFLDCICEFLQRSASDPNRSYDVLKSAIGLLGDLGQSYAIRMQGFYRSPFIAQLFQQVADEDTDIQDTSRWAQSVIKDVMKMK